MDKLIANSILIVLLLLGGIFLYWLGYNHGSPDIVEVRTDTVRVQTIQVDTLWRDSPERIVVLRVPEPTETRSDSPSPVAETQLPSNTSRDTARAILRTYEMPFADSLLTGEARAEVEGYLLSWEFDYQINIPEITRTVTDSVFVNTETVIERKRFPIFWGFSAAALISDTPRILSGPFIGLTSGNLSVRYSPSFGVYPEIKSTPTHVIGLSYTF